MTTITLPTIPTYWTPGTIITYLASLTLLALGALASFGVAIPKGIAPDVALIAGFATAASGGLLALIHHGIHQSTIKAIVAAKPELLTTVTAVRTVPASTAPVAPVV
jgi:hypothetical protein